ncbi:JSN1 Protein JSN1 [Candida maltosa Xu316]
MKITIDPPPQHQPRLRSQTISTPIGIDQPQNSNLLSQPQFQPQHQHGINHQPSLYDNSDFRNLNLTTTFQNPNLGPTKYLLFDNLPFYIDSLKLNSIISNSSNQRSLGNIISIKITTTTTSKLALIECSNIETAMNLKASFNHLELVPGSTLYVAFAKIEDSLPQQRSPLQVPLQTTQPPQPQSQSSATSSTTSAQQQQQSSYLHHSLSESSSDKPGPTDVVGIQKSLMSSINKLSSTVDTKKIQSIIDKCIAYPQKQYQNDFGPLPDPIPLRQFDSPTLRELRKTLENNEVFLLGQDVDSESEGGVMTEFQLEELCLAMLDELPELCYDYLGNTIVQKIFTLVESPLIKLMMVKEIAPFLTQLGIHKNGTWAIQKIINLCHSDYQQMYLIGASLKPYAVKLFNDQFGNYVIQGCIKFGSPFNDFVFEAMLDNFLEISVGRFGARCIRTILESCHDNTPTSPVSNEQVLLVAGLIVEYANELVVNSNGSLLITWYLDTFNDCDSKIELLMSKFLPSLRSLCVHKLANLTILKILSNRIDQNSRITIIESIFSNTESLEYILQDSENSNTAAGPLFIYKILSNSILGDLANQYVPTIRKILMELNIVNFQNYKKLMDEVGISSTRIGRNGSMKRNGNGVARRGNHNGNYRGNKQQNQHQHQHQQQQQQQQQSYFSSNLAPSLSPSQLPIQQPQQNINSQYSSQYIHLQPSQQYPVLTPQMYMKQMYGQQQQQQQSSQQLQQPQQQLQQPQQQLSPQELAVMQQLEQLSLSSAALGYNSNPGTPTLQRNSFN